MVGNEHSQDDHADPRAIERDSGELFPRQEIAAAVSAAQGSRDRRESLITWVLAAGMGILALGLPDERLVGSMPLVRAATDGGGSFTGMPTLVRMVSWVTGAHMEAAAFLLAALSWMLLLPALRSMLLTVGFPRSECLLLAIVGVISPTAFAGGTLPIEHAPGMLGATLLMGTLFRTKQRMPYGYQWRVTLVLFAAVLLRLENLLLAPAAALALADQGRARGLPWAFPPAILTLVLAVGVTALVGENGWVPLGRELLAGTDPSLKHLFVMAMRSAIGLGALSVGLWVLLLGRRSPEETPPPRWVVPWCVLAFVPILGGDLNGGPVIGFLVPMGVLGLADLRVRTNKPHLLKRIGALCVGVQLALCASMRLDTMARDGLESNWRNVASRVLQPGDALWTKDWGHRYLIQYRWVDSGVSLRDPGSDVPPDQPGGRAILDGDLPATMPGMLRLNPKLGLVTSEYGPRTPESGSD
jgi:hypothetical protein